MRLGDINVLLMLFHRLKDITEGRDRLTEYGVFLNYYHRAKTRMRISPQFLS